ncbi:hypothetical protein BV25DRAFT_85030 [Artomyces pyxidatus]|uniref:Uncharacterized protein n=1 Tax=Artomyces pyxidatus TaxID=48021 RepID=A0ACB8TKZ3_9AGAM|nr:hypothetical protein BV25DRAFT_85030 [Artomyces pyxidatus]
MSASPANAGTHNSTMPFFNVFKSRRKPSPRGRRPSFAPSDDSDFYQNPLAYATFHNEALPRSPPVFRPHSSRSHRPEVLEDEPWQLLNHSQHQRSVYDDYYPGTDDGFRDDLIGEPVHIISESSRVDSPIPIVQRQGPTVSRLYEQFTGSSSPGTPVTRLDFRSDHESDRDYRSPASHFRSASTPSDYYSGYPHDRWETRSLRSHQYEQSPPPTQHAVPVVPSSSASSVVHKQDDGIRVSVPRIHIQSRRPSSSGRHGDHVHREKPRTFYIVPPGMNVIFTDETGRELSRVGDFSGNTPPMDYQEEPIILQDEYGREVYRTGIEISEEPSQGSDETDRPHVVHLGRFVPSGPDSTRSASPITVSLDQYGQPMYP